VTLAAGWNNITCEQRLAGSAVHLYEPDGLSVCEIEVWGTIGPQAPKGDELLEKAQAH